jgi:hypothetical protein
MRRVAGRWLIFGDGGGSGSSSSFFFVGLQNPDFFNAGKIDEIVLIINIIIIILK